jgi:hypothetical protein
MVPAHIDPEIEVSVHFEASFSRKMRVSHAFTSSPSPNLSGACTFASLRLCVNLLPVKPAPNEIRHLQRNL